MAANQTSVTQIFAQASTLFERLDNMLPEVHATEMSQEWVNERLAHWCEVVAQGDQEKFQKRLHWDGLDINKVVFALKVFPTVNSEELPAWAKTLTEIIEIASAFSSWNEFTLQNLKPQIPIVSNEPVPFEQILLPAILVARQKLQSSIELQPLSLKYLSLKLLSQEAYLSLEHSLLNQLSNLSARTLGKEFSQFCPLGQTLFSLLKDEVKNTSTSSKNYYNAFVQKLLQDGLLSFFQKYPVLGRLIATCVEFWVEATLEFLQRLEKDLPTIQQVFNCLEHNGQENKEVPILGKVVAIKPALAEFHNRGRSPITLTFESGLRLVYKPKSLASEVTYNHLLEWCNQGGIPLPFKVFQVLNCQAYGWAEYVEQQPCENEAAAKRFYQRAGMLLCLMYVLGGTDCHYQNLIAHGEHLVLIDTETLLHHQANIFVERPAATEAEMSANQHLLDSVLRSLLLPQNKVGGLSSASKQPSRQILQWKSVNTDEMRFVHQLVPASTRQNVPVLNGVALSSNEYLKEVIEGFRQMYRFLMNQRGVLLATDSPLVEFQTQQMRFLVRDSHAYWNILQNALAPNFLRNGIDWSIELDVLSRAFLTVQDKPNVWPILHAERRAMEQLDIPHFQAACNSNALPLGAEQLIEQYFVEPSYNKAISRLQALSETNLNLQIALIRGVFYARSAQAPEENQMVLLNPLKFNQIASTVKVPLLSTEQLLHEAQKIAQTLQEQAFFGTDGSISWIDLDYASGDKRCKFSAVGESLYQGTCGIALFLGALAHILNDTQLRDMSLGALHSVRQALQTSDDKFRQRFIKRLGIGGSVGLGATIYSLVKVSQFLEEPLLLEEAQRTADLLVPERITSDQKLDVMHGAAGAILGLLALYTKTSDPAVLDKAVMCGQHLLKQRASVDNRPQAWRTLKKTPLTGFAHGAAGIAYALLRLYDVTHETTYLEAAREGIAYERSVFSTDAGNWAVFNGAEQDNQSSFEFVNWCHGAPGIGLARLGGLSILETDEIYQDIEVALHTTKKYGLQGVDHFCCGNSGRIELFLVAAQKLSRPDLLDDAKQLATWMVKQAEKNGAYQLFSNLPNHEFSSFSPSFFRGTAGIGYELLRLAYPETLPSVLLWE